MTALAKSPSPLAEASPPGNRRIRFSLRTAFVAVAFVGLIFAGVHYVLESYKVVLRMPTANHFKMVGLGLMNHNDARGALPYPVRRVAPGSVGFLADHDPTAKPILSWRISITPFMCCGEVPDWNAPWNSVENSLWNGPAVRYFADRPGPPNTADPTSFHTNIMAITGPGTAFGDGQYEPPKRLVDLDTANTILAVETANSGLHYMEPGDFDILTMPRTINDPSDRGISSRHKTGFHVLFADGTVWYLSNKTPFEDLEKFFTVEGGKTHDRDEILGRFVLTRQ